MATCPFLKFDMRHERLVTRQEAYNYSEINVTGAFLKIDRGHGHFLVSDRDVRHVRF